MEVDPAAPHENECTEVDRPEAISDKRKNGITDRNFWFMLFILALINFNEAFQ
jgi:hypothetical protein